MTTHSITESCLGRAPAPDHRGALVVSGLRWDVAHWRDGEPVAWRTKHLGSTWHINVRNGEVRLEHVSPKLVGRKLHQVTCNVRRLEGEQRSLVNHCAAVVASYTRQKIHEDVETEWARVGEHLVTHAEAMD